MLNSNQMRVCDMLTELCSEDSNELLDMHRTLSNYGTGVEIFSEGQHANVVQIIDTGKVKIVSTISGKERIIRLAGDGDIIGHRGFGGDNKYSVSAIVLEPVTLKNIPRKIFDMVLKSNPEFCFQFLIFFAEELRKAEETMKNSVDLPVTNRIAKALMKNIDAFGMDDSRVLNYTPSRKDIASMAITTYETVIRTLTVFDKENILNFKDKKLEITNLSALQELSAI